MMGMVDRVHLQLLQYSIERREERHHDDYHDVMIEDIIHNSSTSAGRTVCLHSPVRTRYFYCNCNG